MLALLWSILTTPIALIMSYAAESKLLMVLVSCTMALIFILNIQAGCTICNGLIESLSSINCHISKRQLERQPSPINIVRSLVHQRRQPCPLFWHNYYELPQAVLLENNGSTVIMRIACAPELTPHLSGIEPSENYYFEEATFKWGMLESEHSIDSLKFALEMQVLHRTNLANANCKFLTISYLFSILEHNKILGQVVDNLEAIVVPGSCIELPPFDLGSLVRPFDSGYYTYHGTYDNGGTVLPTKWLIYSRTFGMSLTQLRRFGELCTHDGSRIAGNARKTQPLGNRCVQYQN
ncbi:carbonic anhydrase 1 [Scaptodrosophila lebanonensis]|uniref:Carbonic anhydrase 1 n=1 Tax=Drosophila lebanonensis TaxID=7225 RepID=A0A6J2UI65_DROLE|nr:carbonic anhydrase 1 [Scaptodrosophila lebanonensis]